MQALLIAPGRAGSARVAQLPAPRADGDVLLLRCLEVGVCGTDREMAAGHFGVAPDGAQELVIGHELLGEVLTPGHGFARGDLVTATVRRSCARCAACAAGAPDSCMTGDYRERGITMLDGFASEVVAERAEHLVAVPRALGRCGVLAEPASICARAVRTLYAVGERQPWSPRRGLVIGAGAIGSLCCAFLRLAGLQLWAADVRPQGSDRAAVIGALGARYVCTAEVPLAALGEEVGDFDVIVEAAGDAQLMLDALALLGRNGVLCLLGIDTRHRTVGLDGTVIGVRAILRNQAVVGSVNANARDWVAGLANLASITQRWPGVLEAILGARFAPEDFAQALADGAMKATLCFADA